MQQQLALDHQATAAQLRPVVITVVAAKLAVFALLMTTLNVPTPVSLMMQASSSVEIAVLR